MGESKNPAGINGEAHGPDNPARRITQSLRAPQPGAFSQAMSLLADVAVGGGPGTGGTLLLPLPGPRAPGSAAEQRLIRALTEATGAAMEGARAKQIAAWLRRAEIILANQSAPLPAGQAMAEIWADIAKVPPGIPALTALRGVQPLIEYQPGLSIIAAPTSAGKTTFLIAQVAEWLLDPTAQGKILFWSAETPHDKLWAKILVAEAKMTLWDVINEIKQAPSRQGAVKPELYQARQTYDAVTERLVVMDEDTTAVELLEVADQLAASPDGLYAVVIDYLQELPAVPDGHPWADRLSRNRELEIGYLARQMRQWGTRTGIPVLAAAQFNRTVSKNSDWVPDLLQLRESGRLEQNAALVLGLRNETMSGAVLTAQNNAGVANPKTYPSRDDELEKGRQSGMLSVRQEHLTEDGWILLESFVLKNREHGGVGTVVPVAMQEQWGRIEPLTTRITVHGSGPKKKAAAGSGQALGASTQEDVSHGDDEYFAPR